MANSGSPYRRASATWSTTSGMPGTSAAGGSGRVASAGSLTSGLLVAGGLAVAAVHVRLLRHAGLLPLAQRLAVQVLVPPDRPPGALLGLDVGALLLELFDELGDVRFVIGTPEDS